MPDMTETSPSGRTRVFLGILGVPLLLVLALILAAYWRMEKRVWGVGSELIDETQALEAARWPRPPHVQAPLPGTFGQAAAPLMAELRAFKASEPKLPEEEKRRCREVRGGQRPVSELPPACRNSLERGRSLMERLLRASHTEEAGPPEGLRTLAPPAHPDHESHAAFTGILRAAALEVRLRTDRGQADSALEVCVDGLALARDLGHGTGLIGAMISLSGHKLLFPPCVAALQGASPAVLPQTIESLRRIREGLSPFSSTLHQEGIVAPILILGRVLDPRQVKQLPVGAQGIVAEGSSFAEPEGFPLFNSFLLRDALVATFHADQRMAPLVDLPPALREPRLQEEMDGLARSWNPLLSLTPPNYTSFARRVDQQRAWLDLLVALAVVRSHRTEHGEWPSALPPLYPEHAVLLPTSLQLKPGPGNSLTVVPDAATRRALETGEDPKELAWTPFELTVSTSR